MPEQLSNMIQQWRDVLFPILVCGLTNAVCLQSFEFLVEFQCPMISYCNVGMFTVANFLIVSYSIY